METGRVLDKIPEKRIVGFSGSPRRGGNSEVLLACILKAAAERHIPVEGVRLASYQYQACIGCEQCRRDNRCTGINDGMHLIYPKVIAARGMVLVCPTHNYNVTAWMKAFIDRLYCLFTFDNNRPRGWSSRLADQHRKAVIAAVCEQRDRKDMGLTMEAMRLPLEALGYRVVGELPVLGIFDRGRVKENAQVLERAASLGHRLADALTR